MAIKTETAPNQPPLTPEQEDNLINREMYDDGMFADWGAFRRDENGRSIKDTVSISPEEADFLQFHHEEELRVAAEDAEAAQVEAQVESFLAHTPEGQQITAHQEALGKFKDAIGQGTKPRFEGDDAPYDGMGKPSDSRNYLEANDVRVDLDRLDRILAPGAAQEDIDYARTVTGGVSDTQNALERLTRELIRHPEYHIGGDVIVERGGKDKEHAEELRTIDGIALGGGSGSLWVASPDGARERVSFDRLRPAAPAPHAEAVGV